MSLIDNCFEIELYQLLETTKISLTKKPMKEKYSLIIHF